MHLADGAILDLKNLGKLLHGIKTYSADRLIQWSNRTIVKLTTPIQRKNSIISSNSRIKRHCGEYVTTTMH